MPYVAQTDLETNMVQKKVRRGDDDGMFIYGSGGMREGREKGRSVQVGMEMRLSWTNVCTGRGGWKDKQTRTVLHQVVQLGCRVPLLVMRGV
jgi:hypothetical protein